ncbi:hypothetical protein [Nocardia sp. CNY236]|uniref:hypothetical protein n=1 Tax=Nocardia sp. CNY236 TaxID=1169152 RepID=UPI00048F06B1|nr:hypothetical protein [Nocardia sp. CNY236]
MATATLHKDNVGGHVSPARCWKLDPPVRIGDQEHEFVCTWVTPARPHQSAEVVAVLATENGAVAGKSVQRRAGSYTLHTDPDTPEHIDGAHWLALQLLGGYMPSLPGGK